MVYAFHKCIITNNKYHMNLLQQLSESKLTKEEIEAIIDISEHAVKLYEENLESLDKVISLYESSENSGLIKMVIESDDGFETKSKTLEEVKEYRDSLIKENEVTITCLGSAASKLKEMTKIFEE